MLCEFIYNIYGGVGFESLGKFFNYMLIFPNRFKIFHVKRKQKYLFVGSWHINVSYGVTEKCKNNL